MVRPTLFLLLLPLVLHCGGIDQGPSVESIAVPEEGTMTVTIVYDNIVGDERLKNEWGFACVISGLEKTVLFDVGGDGAVLLDNLKTLGIDPAAIDVVVLSHQHGDHTAGLAAFLAANNEVDVYMPPSFPQQLKDTVTNAGARLVETSPGQEICPGLYSTGEMGTMIKEQGVYIIDEDGLVVVTGCAHPGIVEMAAKAKELGGADPRLLIGGFHLVNHSDEAIRGIIESFRATGVREIVPTHCTGDKARELFLEAFGESYQGGGAGAVINLVQPLN
jgi:7,8-dihydropterin-6-yl-methyl-4-(beta-D-ribofuranosyl)aminobenzene 5'-phosphate synthase